MSEKLVDLGNWIMDNVPVVGYWLGDKIKYSRFTDSYWGMND